MKSIHRLPLLALLSLLTLPASAKSPSLSATTVPALLLSDIHLDPFHDPAKFSALRAAPASAWAAILYAPASPTQAADFAQLQSTCGTRGVDTPPALLQSSLQAEHQHQSHPLFVTVSGDLLAHQFDCRFHTLAPSATDADYSAFASKTVAFLALQLRETFPRTPIYFALGNNDSGCHDYREDPYSAFLQTDAVSFASAAATGQAALSSANRSAILHQFPQLGDYAITLPAPIAHTRLLVLQDIFESKKFAACNGSPSDEAAAQQIAWLRTQLTAARAAHQHVWIMAHIPPGIDAYTTFTKHRDLCGGKDPDMFLSSGALASTLSDFPDIIRLVLLGHTHMDEFRVFETPTGTIPGKLVPSITPVNGNNPAFTVAEINPSTADLKDYTVYSADNQTGISTTWAEEYRFSTTYHLPDLSGPSLARLTSYFVNDKTGTTPASHDYQQLFFVGDPGAAKGIKASMNAAAMQLVWPMYACAITHADIPGFRTCACPTTSTP